MDEMMKKARQAAQKEGGEMGNHMLKIVCPILLLLVVTG